MHFHVAEGSPKDKILALARVATRRPGDHRVAPAEISPPYLLGSNAAAVVRHAECSVLVVR